MNGDKENTEEHRLQIVVSIAAGKVRTIYCNDPCAEAVLLNWDVDSEDPSDYARVFDISAAGEIYTPVAVRDIAVQLHPDIRDMRALLEADVSLAALVQPVKDAEVATNHKYPLTNHLAGALQELSSQDLWPTLAAKAADLVQLQELVKTAGDAAQHAARSEELKRTLEIRLKTVRSAELQPDED